MIVEVPMDVFHNSHDLQYRAPFGAVPAGSAVTLRLDASPPPASCSLVLWRDGEDAGRIPMTRAEAGAPVGRYTATVRTPPEGALVWYRFELVEQGGRVLSYGNNRKQLGGIGELTGGEATPYQITVYEPDKVPEWFTAGAVYQIFPDRFRRGRDWTSCRESARRPDGWRGPRRVFQEDWDDVPFYTRDAAGNVTRWPFFGGTLEGIREKLLYLKSLGVGALYLNPVFQASSNHKYDTADYMKIDPGFGDEAGFCRLAEEARALGISLLLDGVFAHTGADSVYFDKYGNYGNKGACGGPSSPYYSWYQFDSFPDRYASWWGVADLPKTDKNQPTYRDFIYGGADAVVRRWLRLGARGWRLDVADELPDDFIRGVRDAMTETAPDSLLMGEVWEDASKKVSYGIRRTYLQGGALQSVMNYPFRLSAVDYMLGKIGAFDLAAHLMSLKENYPPESAAMALCVIGSHDRARALTLLGDPPEDLDARDKEYFRLSAEKYGLAKQRLKLLSLIQFTAEGVPCVYYGDEAGLQGFEDPYNRAPYPWGHEDGDLTEHYRLLGLLRSQHRPLREGEYTPMALTEHVFTISRKTADEEIRLLVNRGIFEHETVTVRTGAGYIVELLGSEELRAENGALKLTLPPLTAKLLHLRDLPPAAPELGRAAGILCALSSVPAQSTGSTARGAGNPALDDIFRFIDFLADGSQKLWQLLPLNPAGKGGSPFYSPSLFALGETVPEFSESIDESAYGGFCRENAFWLDDDALYWALKEKNGGAAWQEWPEDEKYRRGLEDLTRVHRDAVEKSKKNQYLRHRAWDDVKAYAGLRGVRIVGDLPIYAAPDSADVWAHSELYRLGGEGRPALHAGVPPDYFSPQGQNWGNPLYDWDGHREALNRFWEQRFRRALALYDVVRIDHFRSFSAYFAIPEGARPADGHWLGGPGIDFFREMTARLGQLPVIAEDLGVQDAPVRNLLKLSGFPGMLVWQFCADELPEMRPAEIKNRVLYSGTHDNQTLAGWCSIKFAGEDPETKAGAILEKLYALPASWVITPLQDVLGLGDDARMNTPGTPYGNWSWRADSAALSGAVSSALKRLAELHSR